MPELRDLITSAPSFVQRLLNAIHQAHPGLNLSQHRIDHVCIRSPNAQRHAVHLSALSTLGSTLLSEAIVGGRPIQTFLLPAAHAIVVDDPSYAGDEVGAGEYGARGRRVIRCIELPQPKEGGRVYEEGWEHAEVAIATREEEAAAMEMGKEELLKVGARRFREFVEETRGLLAEGAREKWGKGGGTEKPFNPEARLEFKEEGFSVKFHWLPLETVIKLENRLHL
ncbi:hypothetical protein HK101_009156 [Irineochytrium annulatum]|nr:hypothetical protein HK101_009156 [Irineochytrium annulatum]